MLITGIRAGESFIGKVGGTTAFVEASVAMSSASSYVSGDFVGTNTTPVTLTNMVRVSGGTGVIQSVTVLDKAVQSIALEIWLFDATVSPPNDSAAWSISDSDAQKCLGVIAVAASDYKASALNSIATLTNVGLAVQPASGRDLFMAIVTRGAPSYTSNDLVISFGVLQD